jgi:hypothetical protein
MRNSYKILFGIRIFGGSRCSWKDDIKMDLREMEWKSVDWIHVAQDKDQWQTLVSTVMNHWVS